MTDEKVRAKRAKDIEIAKLLGYTSCEFVNADGDDCWSLISPNNKVVWYKYLAPYHSQFFEDSIWWYMCPQFSQFIEDREM